MTARAGRATMQGVARRILLASSVVTMAAADRAPAVADALVLDGARIAAVGPRAEVLAERRAGDEAVDLGDATVLPGLIEPHSHPDLCAQLYSWVDVSGFTHPSVAGVERALREAVAERPAGEWIFAFGLDPMLTDDLGTWDRARLDALAPDHPMVVMLQSMHTVFVNSAAFAAAGIDEATPDPPGGGRFDRDAAGNLTGRVVEQPAILVFGAFGLPDPAALDGLMADQLERYRRVGITTVGVAGSFFPMDLTRRAVHASGAPLRAVGYLRHDAPDLAGAAPGDGDERFRIQGVKLWYDGSPYAGTMLLDEPYLASDLCCCTLGIPAGTVGQANFSPDEVVELLGDLGADGWQVLTHVQGDRGSREILDLYERALGGRAGDDHRWRLEHCALTGVDDLRRAERLGVSPSFHVDHVRHYGPELSADIIGPERAERLMPIASAVDCGHRISLHADSPMYPADPLGLARTAVTRLTRRGDRLAPHEAISVRRALAAVTIDAAWQLHLDDEVGSLEPGKRADLAVLDRDPLAEPAPDLDDVGVVATWLDGEPVAGRADRP